MVTDLANSKTFDYRNTLFHLNIHDVMNFRPDTKYSSWIIGITQHFHKRNASR